MIWLEFSSFILWSAWLFSLSFSQNMVNSVVHQCRIVLLYWQPSGKTSQTSPNAISFCLYFPIISCSHTAVHCTVSFSEKSRASLYKWKPMETSTLYCLDTANDIMVFFNYFHFKWKSYFWPGIQFYVFVEVCFVKILHTSKIVDRSSLCMLYNLFCSYIFYLQDCSHIHCHRLSENPPLKTVWCNILTQICLNLFYWLSQKKFLAAIFHRKSETAINSTGNLTNCLSQQKRKQVTYCKRHTGILLKIQNM